MRIWLCWIVILITACETEEYAKAQLEGKWQIDWNYEGLNAMGQLNVREDGLAELEVTNDQNNLITGQSSRVAFQWRLNSDALILERMDNHLKLRYLIQSRTSDSILLLYADDIQITLRRIR